MNSIESYRNFGTVVFSVEFIYACLVSHHNKNKLIDLVYETETKHVIIGVGPGWLPHVPFIFREEIAKYIEEDSIIASYKTVNKNSDPFLDISIRISDIASDLLSIKQETH